MRETIKQCIYQLDETIETFRLCLLFYDEKHIENTYTLLKHVRIRLIKELEYFEQENTILIGQAKMLQEGRNASKSLFRQ